MTQELEFQNPVFNQGENLTVRRGNKWAEHKSAVIQGVLKTISTKVVKFSDLKDEDLLLEHDPKLRTVEGLYKEMCRIYRKFSRDEMVTLVRFNWLGL